MAMRSGFFDSDIIAYDDEGMPVFDRAEDSEFFAWFFGSLVGNGVLAVPANSFKVTADTGLRLKAMPGKCWIEGRFAFDNEETKILIETADTLLNRIDRIVLRMDLQTRYITIEVKKGKPATTPLPPVLIRPEPGASADVYEICIADVLVLKNAGSITQDKITDLRLSNVYCGMVTGIIKQADTTAIFNQYQTYLNQQIAAWNATKTQQGTDWQSQMTAQQTGPNMGLKLMD